MAHVTEFHPSHLINVAALPCES